jgi:hypothetical protein
LRSIEHDRPVPTYRQDFFLLTKCSSAISAETLKQ